jgi:3'(2'), 5'-bisphosphate nucleotidase
VDPADASKGQGAIFAAVRGAGAQVLPLDGAAPPAPVHVSTTDDPAQARFCESVESGHSSHSKSARVADVAGITRDPVRLDSQAKYVVVARGEAEAYLRLSRGDYREKIWDHAAGFLICAEAGGRATDLEGKPLDFSAGRKLEHNRGVIVSNGALHDRLVAAVREVENE